MPQAPLIGRSPASAEQQRKDGWRATATIVLIAAIFGSMMATVIKLSDFLHQHPAIANFFPFIAALSVCAIVPLAVYLGYQGDFPDVNPLIPSHYARLARRCFVAMANPENNGKVTGKDL